MDDFPLLHAANALERVVEQIEQATGLDPAADRVHDVVAQAIPNGPRKDFLSGTWLGHSLHPMLTDLPIGCWTSAFVLDIVGGKKSRPAAQLLVGLGVLSSLPTAASGAADSSDTGGESRRVGLVHAAANTSAVVLYAWSWKARRQSHHARGVALGFLGRPRRRSAASWAATCSHARASASTTRPSTPARPTGRRPSRKRASRPIAPGRGRRRSGAPPSTRQPHLRRWRDLSASRRAARRRHVRCRHRDVSVARELFRARGRRVAARSVGDAPPTLRNRVNNGTVEVRAFAG